MRLRLLSPGPGNSLAISATDIDRSPASDFWYKSVGRSTRAGKRVSDDTAMSVSAFYAGVRLISETLGALPINMFRRVPRGKRPAPNHPLQETLHDQPNPFQTAMEWKELTIAHAIMRGDGISQKIPGDAGDNSVRLIPLNPSRVEMRLTSSNRILFTVTRGNGQRDVLIDDEVFRVRAFSSGLRGLGIVGLARETLGLSLATEEHGARFFTNASTPSGAVKHPANVSAEAQERFEASWARSYSGVENANSVLFLEEGMEWQTLGLSNEDSQFLETREFQVVEVARWLRLPPHMLGDMDNAIKANVEEQSRSFLLFSMFPWIKRFEHAIRRDLIVAKRAFFAEFNLDALMRADLKTRMASYQVAINNGLLNANEIRELENRNPYRGGDRFFMPLNLTPAGQSNTNGLDDDDDGLRPQPAPQPALPAPTPPAASALEGEQGEHQYVLGVMARALALLPEQARISNPPPASERLQAIIESAADRIVAKEIKRVTDKAPSCASNASAWAEWVSEFYADHIAYVSNVLAIDSESAREYCDEQREDVLTNGIKALKRWRYESPPKLAKLALEGTSP